MENKTATLLGASGLIGSFLLKDLLENNDYQKVLVIGRKHLDIQHPKLEQKIIDFHQIAAFENAIIHSTTLFCCIGTTMKNVQGNQQLYKSIDFDIPVNAAKFASSKGVNQFHLVSAIGANSKSKLFYNQLKGQVEEAVQEFNFTSLHIYQPGLLIGKRSEFRLGELIAQKILPLFNFLMIGKLQKYKSIKAKEVARAMYNNSLENKKGNYMYTFKEMKTSI